MELIEAQKLAIKLMDAYGLIDDWWTFGFDNSKNRFGICSYSYRKEGELGYNGCSALRGRIQLSKNLVKLNTEDKVRDIILHKIAHALTPGHHHDKVWAAKALEIGCNGERCFSPDKVNMPKAKYIAKCSSCNKEYYAHRMSKRLKSCGKCSKSFSYKYLLDYKENLL